MKKIEFTSELNDYIVEQFNQGYNKTEVVNNIKTKFEMEISEKTLYRHYKELGLNGNTKKRQNIEVQVKPKTSDIEPWYDVFTNDIFPDAVGNCIFRDLGVHYTLNEIASAHRCKVQDLIPHMIVNTKEPLRETRRFHLLRVYERAYANKDTTEYIGLKDEVKKTICDEIKSLNRDYTIESNYHINLFDHDLTVDLYCPERNIIFVGFDAPQHLLLNSNELRKIDDRLPETVFLKNYVEVGGFKRAIEPKDVVNFIDNYLS